MNGTTTSALSASITGRGERTLVLANGLGTSQNAWRHVVRAFADEYRILRFDYVGTPDSDVTGFFADRYETLHGHADDVVELLDESGLTDVTWVGHSVSGTIGLLAAHAAPELIGRLVLIGASPRYMDDDGYAGGFSREAIETLLDAASSDYHAWVGGFSPLVVGRSDCPEVVEEFASHLRRMRPDIAMQTLRSIFLSDHRAVLPHVRQPVLVVQPRDDVAVPMSVGHHLAATLPHATLRVLDAPGHLPHLTAPAEVVGVLRDTLDSWGKDVDQAARETTSWHPG